jgi:hypothetical protein
VVTGIGSRPPIFTPSKKNLGVGAPSNHLAWTSMGPAPRSSINPDSIWPEHFGHVIGFCVIVAIASPQSLPPRFAQRLIWSGARRTRCRPVFENHGANGTFYTLDLQHSYRDGETWKYNRSFKVTDMPDVMKQAAAPRRR